MKFLKKVKFWSLFRPSTLETEIKKEQKIGYVYIEESFDVIFNMGKKKLVTFNLLTNSLGRVQPVLKKVIISIEFKFAWWLPKIIVVNQWLRIFKGTVTQLFLTQKRGFFDENKNVILRIWTVPTILRSLFFNFVLNLCYPQFVLVFLVFVVFFAICTVC